MWYYRSSMNDDADVEGPISAEQLCQDWHEGSIQLISLVWAASWDPGESSAWVPLGQPECAGVDSRRKKEVELLLQLCLGGAAAADALLPVALPDDSSSLRALPDATPACPICLEGLDQPAMLGCGHVFCTRCIATYTRSQLLASRLVSCPCCKRPVSHDELGETLIAPACAEAPGPSSLELSALWLSLEEDVAARRERSAESFARTVAVRRAASRDALRRDLGLVPPATNADGAEWTQQEQRAFERTAARLRLRRCPACQTPIQKQGGCDHMTCRCGNHFSWANAEPVVACTTFHRSEHSVPWRGWHCCRHCGPQAHAKLAAARTARGVVCVPVVATGAAAAAAVVATGAAVFATVVVVPAAVCAPLAMAYEPVRRARNELAYAHAVRAAGGSYDWMDVFKSQHERRAQQLPKAATGGSGSYQRYMRKRKKNVFAQAAIAPAAAVGSGLLFFAYAAAGGYESD